MATKFVLRMICGVVVTFCLIEKGIDSNSILLVVGGLAFAFYMLAQMSIDNHKK